MPIIETHILEGYSEDEKTRLARALTDAALSVVPAKPNAITIMIHEMPRHHYMRGGTHRDPAGARPDAATTVRAYLAAMEARDLDTAKSMLGARFVMNFPAAPGLTTLEELIAWSRPRYAFVKKTYDKVEAFQQGETSVVYTMGTLYGEWLDGTAFEGIRFVDRFELRDGLIVRQDVWNDMGEVKAQA